MARNPWDENTPGKTPWWTIEDSEDAASQMSAAIKQINVYQSDAAFAKFRLASVFANQDMLSMAASSFDPTTSTMPVQIINRAKALIDTVVSRQIQDEVRPIFVVDNGQYEQHQKAEEMERFMQGVYYQANAYPEARMCLRDAAWAGDGWQYVFEQDKKVATERVNPLEMLIDNANSMTSNPTDLYRQQYVSRAWALDQFPEHEEAILELPTEAPNFFWPNNDQDMVCINWGWKLPSPNGKRKGRHIVACGNVVIVDKEWKDKKFPFVRYRWDPAIIGVYSMSLMQQLLPLQAQLELVSDRLAQSIRLFAVPRVWQPAGTKISPEYNNAIGNVYKFTGTQPIIDGGGQIPTTLYEERQHLIDLMDAAAGVSPMELTGDVPSHTDSRPALRETQEIAAGRRSWVSKMWQEGLSRDLSEQVIRVARDIVKEHGSYTVLGKAKDTIDSVDFKDIDLTDGEMCQVTIQPAAFMPNTRTGQRQTVMDLAQTTLFKDNPQDLWQMIGGAPDIDALLNRKLAPQKLAEKQVSNIVRKRKPVKPDQNQDVVYAKTYAQTRVNELLLLDGVPQEIFDLLESYIADCDEIQQAALPPPPPPIAPMQVPGGLPPGVPNGAVPPGPPAGVPVQPIAPGNPGTTASGTVLG